MNRKILAVLTAAGIAGVAALTATGVGYAQRGGSTTDSTMHLRGMQGMAGMMEMMRTCPMMHGMAHGPAVALRHRDSLALTSDQVQRLEAIRSRVNAAPDRAMQQMQALHRDISGVADAERFDEAAARRAFARMGELHADMGIAMLRAGHDTRGILTPAQREKLARLGGGMMGMHGMQGMSGSHTHAMMEQCTMMHGMQGMHGMHGMQGMMGGMRMRGADSPGPAERGDAGADTAAVTVEMRMLAFTPREIRIKAGETVSWVNRDPLEHTVTADDRSWTSPLLGEGGRYYRTFTQPGRYTYHCTPHPQMTGVVIVEERSAP